MNMDDNAGSAQLRQRDLVQIAFDRIKAHSNPRDFRQPRKNTRVLIV